MNDEQREVWERLKAEYLSDFPEDIPTVRECWEIVLGGPYIGILGNVDEWIISCDNCAHEILLHYGEVLVTLTKLHSNARNLPIQILCLKCAEELDVDF